MADDIASPCIWGCGNSHLLDASDNRRRPVMEAVSEFALVGLPAAANAPAHPAR